MILLFVLTPAFALGRPTDCFDTAYQAHPGYNENQETWDRYTAETDGVCQSTYGRGIPSDCEHIVQLSSAGNPYYLCWYNEDSVSGVEEIESDGSLLSLIRSLIARIMNFFSFLDLNRNVTVKTTIIGPYPGKWGCEFMQIPFPNVNKKHVSCPYETPGAAINDAANEFCRQVMSSDWAVAEVCDENGVIVCIHPCETTPAHIIPDRCAFDNDRQRGNQAPPLLWCLTTEETPPTPPGSGRPTDCFDTAYQAHPGYNENQETWDRYTAETDGVCQSTYGRGVPSGCEHIVQLSSAGNPYYLCWYNN